MKKSRTSPTSGTANRKPAGDNGAHTIAVELTHPMAGQPAWSDGWAKKTVKIRVGPTAADLFQAMASLLPPPKGKPFEYLGELEEREHPSTNGYGARMAVLLKVEGETIAIARSPFLRALWRPHCGGDYAVGPAKFLERFSSRSVFSDDYGSAILSAVPKALTDQQQEDAMVNVFRALPDAERRALVGLLATGRPSVFLSGVARR